MTKNKMTEKEIFALVGENAEAFGDKAELILEWVEKHIGQLDRKYSSKSGKLNEKQLENLEIKNKILDRIRILNKPVRVMDISADSKFSAYTSQKLSALIKQLVDEGKLVRYTDKRITYFTIAESVESVEGAE